MERGRAGHRVGRQSILISSALAIALVATMGLGVVLISSLVAESERVWSRADVQGGFRWDTQGQARGDAQGGFGGDAQGGFAQGGLGEPRLATCADYLPVHLDYAGNDIYSAAIPVQGLEECCELCAQTPR
mmetsp:Transcript_6743/g.16272  ORF Transcript_6743/g.16272 Transcript_6743/m.16272 type:complete len:131 (+) Transcript_6743:65-457(+)